MTSSIRVVPANEAGAQGIFAAAGRAEVSRPGIRRAVMRVDF